MLSWSYFGSQSELLKLIKAARFFAIHYEKYLSEGGYCYHREIATNGWIDEDVDEDVPTQKCDEWVLVAIYKSLSKDLMGGVKASFISMEMHIRNQFSAKKLPIYIGSFISLLLELLSC